MKNRGLFLGLVLLVSLSAGGCATHTWAPGLDAKGTFDEASARCSLIARHAGGGDFYAQGSPGFVAGATLGAAVGEAIRTQDDFNDCMKASGWVVADADPDSVARAHAQQMQIASMRNQYDVCLSAVRNNPKYAVLLQHLKSITSGHYTLTQMSDNRIPTPQEAALLAAYGDESDVCTSNITAQIAALDPRTGRAFQSLNATIRNLDLVLINRQISWGDYARKAEELMDAASGHPGVETAHYQPDAPVASPAQGASAASPSAPPQRPCTEQEETQKRIAIKNGYTMIPNCQ